MRAVLAGVVVLVAALPSPAAAEPIAGAYIVTLSEGDPAAAAQRAERRHGAQVDHVYTQALRGYAARMSARAAQEVAGE
ncbi:MAG TPA: hypothetical protein VD931_10340, partial [Baekduia sp.]|nr:hypothetical protein [Baekduia sp.]